MPIAVLPRYAIVIDIETLDTRPSACVLSVGHAKVDTHSLSIIASGQMYIDQNAQIGRSISEDTIKWWSTQPDAWRRQCGQGRASLCELYKELDLVGAPDCLDPYARTTWWGYGPSFDLVVLESLARYGDLTVPWTYRDHRDLRTLFELTGVKPNDYRRQDDLEHDAEADAVTEARAMIEALKRLGYETAKADQPAVSVGA